VVAVVVFGPVLPGDMPADVTVGAFGAPVGAGAGEDMLLVVEGGVMSTDGVVAGAVLPGDSPGVVTVGAFGAPVGAGLGVLVCAKARPDETINAAEASKIERILISCLWYEGVVGWSLRWAAVDDATSFFGSTRD
jgi:hypothetical protein